MSIASSTIELIKSLDVADAVSGGISAFLGAFFAFCFFIISRWIERKHEWKKICKNEHAYLERYLYELKYTIIDNQSILEAMIEGYRNEKIKIMLNKLSIIPIREDSSMKVSDKLFKNRLETYANNGIKRVNRLQEGITQMQDALNNEITGNNPIEISRLKNNIAEFSAASEFVLKLYKYYLDIIGNLIIENRLLLKKYRNWKFDRTKMEKLYAKRSEAIKKEKEFFEKDYLNPLILEQKNNFKKYGLWDEKREE